LSHTSSPFWRWGLANYLSRLTLNHDPPDFRHKPPAPSRESSSWPVKSWVW
jgi:hypothetical protein